jgi:hypothetical protein
LCSKNAPGCVKASSNRYFTEKEYSDEEYKVIRAEADKYEIYVFSEWGYDYGYGQKDSSTNASRRGINDYQIVVSKDGLHFAGVADTSDYYEFNKVSNYDTGLNITLCNDPVDRFKGYPLVSKSGSSFSSDDHEKWDYTYRYLKRK